MTRISDDKIKEMVVELIDRIRPYINRDGGDIEVVSMDKGIVYVKMLGACVGCSALDITVKDGIETMLIENVPGVIGVEVVNE